ncbi:MAG: Gfo/Idh/MocA family oxidoreductase [Candidatus Hydrogenedentes bacterium]|nr:Gfo/Idh/MocA family oxidoreductase [Candidatus Hydrogenedentota bacterium]
MDRVRVGIAGCGSVSEKYLARMLKSPFIEIVSACDIVFDRARKRASEYGIPNAFASLDEMLTGPPFDLFLNSTSMQSHYSLNKKALLAGKHIFSEKPFVGTVTEGRELIALAESKNRQLWAAPNVVTSPQYRYMMDVFSSGILGKVHAAHACYGHCGPSWGPWFYKKGGGSLFDLAVYNITTLTGLLGPARSVTALMGAAIPERIVEGERVRVEADDNVMLLMDHGDSVYSHIQTGFVYHATPEDRSLEFFGTKGAMYLLGWDWGPRGVQILTDHEKGWETHCTGTNDYVWEDGVNYVAECLVTGKLSSMTPEHALHVLEVMQAARDSAETGRRKTLESLFSWPLIKNF